MVDPYLGEIRMFGGNFAPQGWALCQGQLISISENDALFALIGTTYGGDGETTFALPDLRGRLPIHQSSNQGNTYTIGQAIGTETVTLSTEQIPSHTHLLAGNYNPTPGSITATSTDPTSNVMGQPSRPIYTSSPASVPMAEQAISFTGGSNPHENRQPYLCINFIIALEGIFPSQS